MKRGDEDRVVKKGIRGFWDTLMGPERDITAAIPDDELVRRIVRGLMPDDEPTFTRGEWMVYNTFLVAAEVYNGGFNQLVWNKPWLPEAARESYLLIGAAAHAALMDDLIVIAAREAPDRAAYRRRGLIEGFVESSKHTRLGELHERYRALPSIDAQRIAWIRAHPREFLLR